MENYKFLSAELTASQQDVDDLANGLSTAQGNTRMNSENNSKLVSNESAVLMNPVESFNYDIKHGFRRSIEVQASHKGFPKQLTPSESLESLKTIQVSGGFAYKNPAASIATLENKEKSPDLKPSINHAKVRHSIDVADDVTKNYPDVCNSEESFSDRHGFSEKISLSPSKFLPDSKQTNVLAKTGNEQFQAHKQKPQNKPSLARSLYEKFNSIFYKTDSTETAQSEPKVQDETQSNGKLIKETSKSSSTKLLTANKARTLSNIKDYVSARKGLSLDSCEDKSNAIKHDNLFKTQIGNKSCERKDLNSQLDTTTSVHSNSNKEIIFDKKNKMPLNFSGEKEIVANESSSGQYMIESVSDLPEGNNFTKTSEENMISEKKFTSNEAGRKLTELPEKNQQILDQIINDGYLETVKQMDDVEGARSAIRLFPSEEPHKLIKLKDEPIDNHKTKFRDNISSSKDLATHANVNKLLQKPQISEDTRVDELPALRKENISSEIDVKHINSLKMIARRRTSPNASSHQQIQRARAVSLRHPLNEEKLSQSRINCKELDTSASEYTKFKPFKNDFPKRIEIIPLRMNNKLIDNSHEQVNDTREKNEPGLKAVVESEVLSNKSSTRKFTQSEIMQREETDMSTVKKALNNVLEKFKSKRDGKENENIGEYSRHKLDEESSNRNRNFREKPEIISSKIRKSHMSLSKNILNNSLELLKVENDDKKLDLPDKTKILSECDKLLRKSSTLTKQQGTAKYESEIKHVNSIQLIHLEKRQAEPSFFGFEIQRESPRATSLPYSPDYMRLLKPRGIIKKSDSIHESNVVPDHTQRKNGSSSYLKKPEIISSIIKKSYRFAEKNDSVVPFENKRHDEKSYLIEKTKGEESPKPEYDVKYENSNRLNRLERRQTEPMFKPKIHVPSAISLQYLPNQTHLQKSRLIEGNSNLFYASEVEQNNKKFKNHNSSVQQNAKLNPLKVELIDTSIGNINKDISQDVLEIATDDSDTVNKTEILPEYKISTAQETSFGGIRGKMSSEKDKFGVLTHEMIPHDSFEISKVKKDSDASNLLKAAVVESGHKKSFYGSLSQETIRKSPNAEQTDKILSDDFHKYLTLEREDNKGYYEKSRYKPPDQIKRFRKLQGTMLSKSHESDIPIKRKIQDYYLEILKSTKDDKALEYLSGSEIKLDYKFSDAQEYFKDKPHVFSLKNGEYHMAALTRTSNNFHELIKGEKHTEEIEPRKITSFQETTPHAKKSIQLEAAGLGIHAKSKVRSKSLEPLKYKMDDKIVDSNSKESKLCKKNSNQGNQFKEKFQNGHTFDSSHKIEKSEHKTSNRKTRLQGTSEILQPVIKQNDMFVKNKITANSLGILTSKSDNKGLKLVDEFKIPSKHDKSHSLNSSLKTKDEIIPSEIEEDHMSLEKRTSDSFEIALAKKDIKSSSHKFKTAEKYMNSFDQPISVHELPKMKEKGIKPVELLVSCSTPYSEKVRGEFSDKSESFSDYSILPYEKTSFGKISDMKQFKIQKNALNEMKDAVHFVKPLKKSSSTSILEEVKSLLSFSRQSIPAIDSEKKSFTPIKVPDRKKDISAWNWSKQIVPSPIQVETGPDVVKDLKSVSATTSICGADIKTIYHFGPTLEFVEVFIDGELRAKIVKDEVHDIYSNTMKSDDLPLGSSITASTVIEANGCVMRTDVSRKENKETIAVYKNDQLLCRAGNTVLK